MSVSLSLSVRLSLSLYIYIYIFIHTREFVYMCMCVYSYGIHLCSRTMWAFLSKGIVAWHLRHPQSLSFSKATNKQTHHPAMNLSKAVVFVTRSKEVWVTALIPPLTLWSALSRYHNYIPMQLSTIIIIRIIIIIIITITSYIIN